MSAKRKDYRLIRAKHLLSKVKYQESEFFGFSLGRKNFAQEQKFNWMNVRWLCSAPNNVWRVIYIRFPATLIDQGVWRSHTSSLLFSGFKEQSCKDMLESVLDPRIESLSQGNCTPTNKTLRCLKTTQEWICYILHNHVSRQPKHMPF